jgi:hypothetical protein
MDKNMALQIINTIAENMKDGVQKAALVSVAAWIQETVRELPTDPDERRRLAERLRRELGLDRPPLRARNSRKA